MKFLKILIIDTDLEITYLVIGSGITIRSVLSSERAAQLMEKEAMDLILGLQHLSAGAAAWKFPEDQAA